MPGYGVHPSFCSVSCLHNHRWSDCGSFGLNCVSIALYWQLIHITTGETACEWELAQRLQAGSAASAGQWWGFCHPAPVAPSNSLQHTAVSPDSAINMWKVRGISLSLSLWNHREKPCGKLTPAPALVLRALWHAGGYIRERWMLAGNIIFTHHAYCLLL